MSSNIDQFLKELEKMEKDTLAKVRNIMIDITTEIFNALLEDMTAGGTPRATGFLASSWNISLDAPDMTLTGSRTNVAAARGSQEASYNNFITADLSKTKMIYLNNVVPYGPLLNNGDKSYIGYQFRERSLRRGKARFSAQRNI